MDDTEDPMGIREESYQVTIGKLKATAVKKHAARYQASYFHKSLCKPSSVLTQASPIMLKEINWLNLCFPEPENNPISEGNYIEILLIMVPSH